MQLTKRFYNHKGVDLKSSDIIRPSEYASDMLNAQYTDGGAIQKRKGYQAHASSCGGYGTWTYRRVDPETGEQVPEVVTVDQNLFKLSETTLTVSYGGANTTCVLSLFMDVDSYRMQILEGTTMVLNSDLDVGFDEASPKTITELAAEINALAGFTATVTGSGTVPAAFQKIIREIDLVADDFVGITKYWTQVNSPVSNPLSTYYADRYDSSFENVSSIQVQNVIYFGTGYNELMKYDGVNFYRAGLPTPISLSAVLAAGAITGSNYTHKIQYIQLDGAGNIIEGNLFTSTAQDAAAQQFTLTIPNVLAASGFNTNCAVVNGLQAGVTTITVDNGSGGSHTMKVGDTAYFFDGVSADYVTREVTAVAATTITIAGANVNVADNAVISNNLRIAVWRSKSSAVTPTAFYYIVELPNNSFTATQSFVDNNVDSALGELLLPPVTDRSPPPKGRYVSQWNGLLVIAGNFLSPTTVYWSDVDGPEYFPNNSNQILVEPGNGDVVTGIAPNNEVFTVHGENTFTVISGELSTGQIRVETRSRDTGCTAHATIQDMDGTLVWMTPNGPRGSAGGQIPFPIGAAIDPSESNQASRLDPEFIDDGKSQNEIYRTKRAVGYSNIANDQYFLYIPTETDTGSLRYPNEFSRTFVYDRVRDAWLIWSNMNLAGGITAIEDETYFIERRFSDFTSSVQSIMYRRHNLKDAFDYADNTDAVSLDYSPQWEFLGEPSVLKDVLAIRVFALELISNNQFTLTIEQEINFQADSNVAVFTLDVTGGGYGYTEYGNDAYSDPTQDAFMHPMARGRIRSVRPRFKNETIHENIFVTGWELEFSTPYRPEFKR